MKRLITAALLALSSSVFAATLVPVTLINPAGSTAGNAIISTGPTTPPTFGTVTLSGVSGTLAIANGGTGATSAAGARTNLGLGTAATANTGTSGANVPLLNAANTWAAGQTFSMRPTFNGAAPWDSSNLPTPASTVGSTSGTNASAGHVGEVIAPSLLTNVSMTSGNFTNCGSVTLTPGDWDVSGSVAFTPAGTTVTTAVVAGLSTTSNTSGGVAFNMLISGTLGTGLGQIIATPVKQFNVSATTTVYLLGESTFGTSTMTCTGASLLARRRD